MGCLVVLLLSTHHSPGHVPPAPVDPPNRPRALKPRQVGVRVLTHRPAMFGKWRFDIDANEGTSCNNIFSVKSTHLSTHQAWSTMPSRFTSACSCPSASTTLHMALPV